jgi:glycerol kinase
VTPGHVLAIDQGTGSTKCLLVDERGDVVARGSAPLAAEFPRPGWVEQSPDALLDSVRDAVGACLAAAPDAPVAALALSTQRESVLAWDRASGRPLGPLLSWQDRRQVEFCAELARAGHADDVRARSGLPLDPMFSAAKIRWLLDSVDPDRSASRAGRICVGTVDCWLATWLTGRHVTEIGNASRTQLVNIAEGDWDELLMDLFDVPRAVLPAIIDSTGDGLYAIESGGLPALRGTPVRAILGDSHAALYAHGRPSAAPVKVTYGTGSSVVIPTADDGREVSGLARTIVWGDPQPQRAVEGNITSTGATLTWLSRLLQRTPAELAELAVGSGSDGVHIVPAFGGLSAPYWDGRAEAVVDGLTLATGPAQLARAAVESIAFQVADVIDVAGPGAASAIFADGGASANDMLMQFQADVCGLPVLRSRTPELSALGAARMAGVAAGLWGPEGPARTLEYDRFEPRPLPAEVRRGWSRAIARARLRDDDHPDPISVLPAARPRVASPSAGR